MRRLTLARQFAKGSSVTTGSQVVAANATEYCHPDSSTDQPAGSSRPSPPSSAPEQVAGFSLDRVLNLVIRHDHSKANIPEMCTWAEHAGGLTASGGCHVSYWTAAIHGPRMAVVILKGKQSSNAGCNISELPRRGQSPQRDPPSVIGVGVIAHDGTSFFFQSHLMYRVTFTSQR